MREKQMEMDRAHQELELAQETIRRLEQQLHELNEAKRDLETKEQELMNLTKQLQSERLMSEEERGRLVSEITFREAQVAEMRTTVDAKTTETNKLQQQVEEQRYRQLNTPQTTTIIMVCKNTTLSTMDRRFDYAHRELDRITATDQNVNIKRKLEMLTKELDMVKDDKGITDYDVLHMENRRAGRDKYKTLRQIRGGNTKRRIDQYENL
uniref:Uncharacterized protein n=1 Tax=Ditylenchus dipsaci TaxID=166011 RepID=A0A915D7V9_9BILA